MNNDKLLLPNSTFLFLWAFFFSLFIIVYFSIAFFVITFQAPLFQYFFNSLPINILIVIIIFIDTVILLSTSFVKNGKLIKDRKRNIQRYLQSKAFWIDIFILTVFIIRIILSESFMNQQEVLEILNLFIVFKFYKIHYYGARLKFYYFQQQTILLYQFFKYIILLGLLCHLVGCLFFTIDFMMIEAQWYPLQDHWLIQSSAMNGLYYAPIWQQYIYSFYFANVTLSTIAYGDITPRNPSEVIFVICLQALLLMVYAYVFTQIYDVITWFNRRKIELRKKKLKISNFLEREGLNKVLSGQILTQIEYKQKYKQKGNRQFSKQLSTQITKKYNKSVYKHEADKFMPRFIRRLNLLPFQFNSLITQQFFTPHYQFQAFDRIKKESLSERRIFYISHQTIIRKIVTGLSSIQEFAEPHRWLGINTFITSQMDINEWWSSEMPINLLVLKFSVLKKCLQKFQQSHQIFMEQCHKTLQLGGHSEDMNKCLLCGIGYHSTLNCTRNKSDIFMDLKQKRLQNQDRKYKKRKGLRIDKILKGSFEKSEGSEKQGERGKEVQVDFKQQKYLTRKRENKKLQQIWDWQNYMVYYNFLFKL